MLLKARHVRCETGDDGEPLEPKKSEYYETSGPERPGVCFQFQCVESVIWFLSCHTVTTMTLLPVLSLSCEYMPAVGKQS